MCRPWAGTTRDIGRVIDSISRGLVVLASREISVGMNVIPASAIAGERVGHLCIGPRSKHC
jgi:hypothetical protein